jgi:hypothetical protein
MYHLCPWIVLPTLPGALRQQDCELTIIASCKAMADAGCTTGPAAASRAATMAAVAHAWRSTGVQPPLSNKLAFVISGAVGKHICTCLLCLWLRRAKCSHAVSFDHKFLSRPLVLDKAEYAPAEAERLVHVQTPQYYPQQAAPQQYGPGNPQGVEQPWAQNGQPQQQAPYQQGASMYASSSPANGQANPAWQPQQQQQGRIIVACSMRACVQAWTAMRPSGHHCVRRRHCRNAVFGALCNQSRNAEAPCA